jgi:cyanophycin synthetase
MNQETTAPARRIRVLERQALMGPNLYAHRSCIKWKIALGALEEQPSNSIPGFVDALKQLLPTLIEHRCSEGTRGGFFTRLEEGTWMGHVMEHIALELQSLVGVEVGFGRTRSVTNETGVYNVVYECDERETGIMAGQIALDIIEALIAQQAFPLTERLNELRRTSDRRALGPSTRSIVDAASRRGIPHLRVDEWNLVQLGYGANAKKIQATIASTTRFLGVEIAGDKDATKAILGFHGVPVPKGGATRHLDTALEIAHDIGWPVVVKPLDASKGRGIVTNIRTEEDLRIAFENAQQYRGVVIVEKYLEGHDFRVLVINHRFVAASQRVPAHVVGDGEHTIPELVATANNDPRRGESHEKVLTKITIDGGTERLLALRGLSPQSVPERGQIVYLKTTANLSTGGTAIDVTDRMHPANVEMAERISKLVDLNIAGIDIVAPSVETPLAENGGGIVEVNAAPGFRMHLAPTEGKPRPVGEAVVDFPPGAECRIPIVTITGTNGKTTTSRLCAHIGRAAGKSVGLTTSDGIYIQNALVQKGDTTGPSSAAVVLRDPAVNYAVLETARGGILRAGVGYDWSNVAVVTNIAADHLGLRDIHTVEDLAHVKAVTVERVFPNGYAVLNAEDKMTPLIRKHADCKLAFFSNDPQEPTFREHVDAGGLGATVESGMIVLYDHGVRVLLCEVATVPITFGGKARFNVGNVLAAVIATYATGLKTVDIVSGLQSFYQSQSQTPGRVNFVDFDGFRVLIDYAHNPHGIAALSDFVRALPAERLVAVVGIPGDRRDSDIRECGRVLAQTFHHVVLREDFDRRGRGPGEVAEILRQSLVENGVDPALISPCYDEPHAIAVAVQTAKPGDLIVYFADKPEVAAKLVDDLRKAQAAGSDPAATRSAS